MRKPKEIFDYDEFAKVWNSSNSVGEAARRLGIPYETAHSRACHLKQFHGYDLKRFKKVNQAKYDKDWFSG